MTVKKPRPEDVFAGKQLRTFRLMNGWTQERLAEAVGLTFQQIQKYEKGANRMGASRLAHFSKLLDVPVASFFAEQAGDRKITWTEIDAVQNFTASRDGQAIIKAWPTLNAGVRAGFVQAIEAAAR